MNRRIEIRFAPVSGVRYVADVTAIAKSGTAVLFDADRDCADSLAAAAWAVEAMLASGTWRISFPEMLDRAPMEYDRGVAWRRLVAFRTDLVIEEVAR